MSNSMTQQQYDARLSGALRHAKQDMLAARTYGKVTGDQFRGCSVGCDAFDIGGLKAVKNNPHKTVAKHYGTPVWLEHLRDSVFERLDEEHRSWWHVELARSLPVGVDFRLAYHLIMINILEKALENKSQWREPYASICIIAIEGLIECHKNPEKADWVASAARASVAEEVVAMAAMAAEVVEMAEVVAMAEVAAMAAMAAMVAAVVGRRSFYKRLADDIINIFTKMREKEA